MIAMVSVDQALDILGANRLMLDVETIEVSTGAGRRLVAPLYARLTQPPAPVSAMDGYAVRLADVQRPGNVLRVIGEAPAGRPFNGRVHAGEAVRIFTGAHMPAGSNHVVIQEDTRRVGARVICDMGYTAPEYVRAAGIDFSEGDLLIPSGSRLSPVALALAAAANHATIDVAKRPRVGILANGDELRAPGACLADGEVVNANPAGLSALVSAWGGDPVDLGIAADSVESIQARIQSPDIDVFVPVGGASVGDHDHMRAAFLGAGFEAVFEKVAVKPGKPTWFSRRGPQRALGLPGNPASALVCAQLFLKPFLEDTFSIPTIIAELTSPLPANGNREQFLRASAHVSDQGGVCVTPLPNQDSSLLVPFLSANALIRRSANAAEAPQGAKLSVVMIAPL